MSWGTGGKKSCRGGKQCPRGVIGGIHLPQRIGHHPFRERKGQSKATSREFQKSLDERMSYNQPLESRGSYGHEEVVAEEVGMKKGGGGGQQGGQSREESLRNETMGTIKNVLSFRASPDMRDSLQPCYEKRRGGESRERTTGGSEGFPSTRCGCGGASHQPRQSRPKKEKNTKPNQKNQW